MPDILHQLESHRIVPVVALDRAEDAAPLADALVAGGLPVAEITFRTAAAESAIRALAKRPEMLLGAGTVLNLDNAKRAQDAGAKFIVSPGFNPKVVAFCLEQKIPITPGIATPTEIEMALDHGLSVVKFFPAESIGGIKTLKAFSAPYGMIRFIPTGGITTDNLAEYLKFPKVLAVGGSWMVSKELLAERQFDRIRDITRNAVDLAEQFRPATR